MGIDTTIEMLDRHEADTLTWLKARIPPQLFDIVKSCLEHRKSLHESIAQALAERASRAEESAARARENADVWLKVAQSLANGDNEARILALAYFPELREVTR